MKYFNSSKPITLNMTRDLTKHIKRGNPWVFSDVLSKPPKAESGVVANLMSSKGELLGQGFYCPKINLAFRMLTLGKKRITDEMIEKRLDLAIDRRLHILTNENNTTRLINGEGDDLPGLVCDIYGDVAVIKLDGDSSEGFWYAKGIAEFLLASSKLKLKTIYQKRRNNADNKGEILAGEEIDLTKVQFLEHGVVFESNIIDAAKTGFFIDQRENRNFIRKISNGKTLLNMFGYTGGFSVYAGLGGATQVTTVDIATEAIKASQLIWKLNKLEPSKHEALTTDCFKFVEEARKEKRLWDIVITDPPSFAPNQKAIETAKEAYIKIFADSIRLTRHEGIFVASSCSGHISSELFVELCAEAVARAKSRGKILAINGQPEDHPFPMALPELRYLKFVMIQIFKDDEVSR
jgi:23S rRNA (cytosine1962-C5)-methyltransferase